VREELVVRGGQGAEQQGLAGRVDAQPVPEVGGDDGLVERDPELHPVAERGGGEVGVLREAVRRVPVPPAARVLQRLRQVPVVQRGHRVDAAPEQLVHQPVVERDAGRVRRTAAGGLDARPGEGEPVPADAQVGHQRHVLPVPVVVVAGHVAGAAVGDAAGLVRERVPDGWTPPVLAHRALDLVRRGGHAPPEVGWKRHHSP
jgi:hypothetical protein